MVRRSHGGHNEASPDFSAGLNPLGPPPSVLRAIRASAPDVDRYPYRLRDRLRRRVAERHDLPVERVLITAGASGALLRLRERFRGDHVQLAVPTYTEYEDGFRDVLDVDTVARWPLREAVPPSDVLSGFVPDSTDLMLLCNPNNPTGQTVGADTLLGLADRARHHGTHLAVDEAYVGFTRDPRVVSLAGPLAGTDNVWVIRSLTKIFAMPGLRVGYLLGPPGGIDELRTTQSPWPVGTPALQGALAALEEVRFLERTRRFMRRERRRVIPRLRDLPRLSLLSPGANFVLCRGPKGWGERLRDRGWSVRNASTFTGLDPGWIRFSLQRPSETDRLLDAVESVLDRTPREGWFRGRR